MLASEENLLGLLALNRELVGQAEAFDDSERVVLDMDCTESPVPWPTGRQCLQRTLRVGLLPPAVVCSTSTVIVWRRSCVPATCTAPRTGMSYCCRRSSANRLRASWSPSGGMQPFAKPEIYEASEERGVQYGVPTVTEQNRTLSVVSRTP